MFTCISAPLRAKCRCESHATTQPKSCPDGFPAALAQGFTVPGKTADDSPKAAEDKQVTLVFDNCGPPLPEEAGHVREVAERTVLLNRPQ
jgi:hypothetical protein